jgi:hypothetical protein
VTPREIATQAIIAQVLSDPAFIVDCARVARDGLSDADFKGHLSVNIYLAPELDRASVEIAAIPSKRRTPGRITFAIKLGQGRTSSVRETTGQ